MDVLKDIQLNEIEEQKTEEEVQSQVNFFDRNIIEQELLENDSQSSPIQML